MRKALRIAVREYLAMVKTKGFIIGLAVAPLFMGGSIIAMLIFKENVDTTDRIAAIVDRSGVVAEPLIKSAQARNDEVVYNLETGKKVKPVYHFEIVTPDDENPAQQRLELSNRVRNGELHAFIEIGRDVLNPKGDSADTRISYYSENSALDDLRRWVNRPINNYLRHERLAAVGIDSADVDIMLAWFDVEGLGLVSVDEETGEISDARRAGKGEAIGIPAGMAMLTYMMIMMGKVIGGIAVSLTSSAVYVLAAVVALTFTGFAEYIPGHAIPWFFIYVFLAIILFGATNAALGAVCNDQKDAQNLTFPAMIPIILPLFVMIPVAKEPLAGFATWLSLFPPFVPTLMVLRLCTPVAIPAWQPWVGLIGLIIFAVTAVWAGGRIFRIGILLQGKPPNLSNLLRWAIRG
jgi:ABC-2 type transport system permease protein